MCFTPYLPDLRASHPEQFRVNRAWPTLPRYTPHIRFLFVRLVLCYRLPPSKSLPSPTCRVASPSPVRADSELSPHRHTCTARRNRIGGMGLLPMPSFHTTVRMDPYTAVPSNRLNSQSDAIPRAEQSEQARSILFVSGTRLSRSWKAPDSRPPSNSFYSSLRPSSPSLWTLPVS